MIIHTCPECSQRVWFNNLSCTHCHTALGYDLTTDPAEPGNRGHIAHEQITILERHHRAATDAAFKPAGTS